MPPVSSTLLVLALAEVDTRDMASRRLVLVRHSKAGDGDTDLERPLTERGRHDAAAIGGWLDRLALAPDQAVVSPARRTVETWEHVCALLPTTARTVIDGRIYENTVAALLAVIRDTAVDVTTLALVGHNPSIEALANDLDDGHGAAVARAELAGGYPTSGVAVFTLHTPFADVQPSAATLTHFAVPRGVVGRPDHPRIDPD
jgi:phosphohistidine phosphatase